MTDKQKLKFLAALIEHSSGFDALSKDDAQWVIEDHGKEAVALCVQAIKNRSNVGPANEKKISKDSILKLKESNILIMTSAKDFVIADHFRTDNKDVSISYVDPDIEKWFSETVKDRHCYCMSCHELCRSATFKVISEELKYFGRKFETNFAAIYAFMKRQPKGFSGMLLTNGFSNIFFVRDRKNKLRAVRVFWCGDGWGVGAYSVSGPCGWDAGYQVFSRDS